MALTKITDKSLPEALEEVAEGLISAARSGDLVAIKEIADRLDGKSRQASEISGPDGGPQRYRIQISFVEAKDGKRIQPDA